jgi:glycine cleavage system regulatory protein
VNTVDISAWGDNPPEFIRVLANLVKESGSNAAAARRLGINRASVSTLLANKYPASTDKMAQAIMAWSSLVECPVLGAITGDQCQTERNKPFVGSNQMRIRLFRACRSCPRNPECGKPHHG